MKRKLKSALSLLLCMIMVFGAVAVGGEGIGELFSSGKAEAAELSISQTDVFKKYPQYLYNPYASKLELNCLTASLDALTSYSKADSGLASFLTAVKDGMSITIRMFSSMLKIQASLEDQYLKDSAMQFLKTVNGSETVFSQSVSIVDNVWKPIKESWGAASAVISYNDQIKESAKLLEKATKMGSSNAAGVAKAIVEKSNEQSVVKTIGSCVKGVDEGLLAAKSVAMMTELYAIDCKMIETIMANVPKNSEIYKGLNLVLQDRYKSPLNYLTNEYFTQKAMKSVGSYIGKALKEGNSLYGPVSAVVSLAAFVASNYIWKGQTAEDYIKACHMTSFASEIGHVVSDYKNKFVNKTYTGADIDAFKTLYSAYIMALKASANLSYAAAKSKQQKNAIYPFCTIMGNNLTYDKYIDSCIINIKADIKDGKLDTSGNFTSVASEQNTKSIAARIEKVMQKYPVGSIVDEESFSFIRKVFSLIYDCEMPIGLNAYRLERRDNVELLGSITKNDLSESGVKALLSKAKKGDIIVGWNQYKANGMLVLGVGETGITVYDCDSHIGGEYVKGKVSSRLISYSALAEGFKKSNDEQMFTPGFSLYRALVCGRISTGMGTNLEYATYDDSVNYVISDGVLTGYNGKRSVLDIPEGVTQIADNCLKNRTSITSVNMPESLISIGQSAFEGCSNLRSVNFNDALESIGAYAFRYCSRLVSAVFGSKLETIGSQCFYNCYSLCSVLLPEIIESIDYYTFAGCTSLESIVIPDSVTWIGGSAFSNCTSLASVTLSKSLESMGAEAFAYCTALTSIEIPKSLDEVTIGNYWRGAFFKCSNLNNVTFEEGTTEIAKWLFAECDGLSEITIPDTVTVIEGGAFYLCSNLEKVIIPDSVTEISYRAFDGCTSLESIIIPDSVTFIGNYSFAGCTSLESIVIPDSVTWIGGSAFSNCTSLASVTLSKSLESMGAEAFAYCTALTSIEIPKSLDEVTIGNYWRGAFFKCSNLNNVTFEEGTTEIAKWLFAECDGLSEITIPDTVTVIEGGAFYLCSNLEKVIIPDSVTEISYRAFDGCTSLENIIIPDSVTFIENYSFEDCSALKSAEFKNPNTKIGERVFSNCSSLASVKLPENLTSIPEYTFNGCKLLADINLPATLRSIDKYAFYNCDALTELTVPGNVWQIGSYAFYDCDSIMKAVIPDSVTSLGSYAFYSCDKLAEIDFGIGLTAIPDSAFRQIPALTKVILPRFATTVAANAFAEDTKLREVTIPSTVTSIQTNSFSYPTKLTVYGIAGSYAEQHAKERKMTFVAVDGTKVDSIAFKQSVYEFSASGSGSYFIPEMEILPKESVEPITFTSSDESIATVNNGKVTFKGFGTATITATTASGKTAACTVKINRAVSGVRLDYSKLSLKAGETAALTATVYPSNAANKAVKWISSAPDVASVDQTGKITALKPGITTITVETEDGGYTATCNVTVIDSSIVSVTGVKLSATVAELTIGNSKQLTAAISPTNATNKGVTWSSSNTNVASVSSSGVVVAKGEGTATITVKTDDGGYTTACTIRVSKPSPSVVAVTGVKLSAIGIELPVGGSKRLSATITPSNATNKDVTWSSDNTSVAAVNASGLITAKGEGTATVTVRTGDGGYTATCKITVVPVTAPEKVEISVSADSLKYMETTKVNVSELPVGYTVQYSSSDESIAKVDSNGNIKAVGKGTATITVKVIDPNGNVARDSSGREISDSVQMNCTMTFWQRIVKWFKNLFGIADTSLKALGLIVAD